MTVEGQGEENDKNATRHHYKKMKKEKTRRKHDEAMKMSHFLLPRSVDISSWGSKKLQIMGARFRAQGLLKDSTRV